MNKAEATLRAIAALREKGDNDAAQALENELLIDGKCQYCRKELTRSFETITLQDTCEKCFYIRGSHPLLLGGSLPRLVELYSESSREGSNCC